MLPQGVQKDRLILSIGNKKVQFQRRLGPEKLPSAYLEELRKEGWTCLNSILSREIVDGLEQVACTGPYEDQEQNSDVPKLCQHVAVGRSIAEPISLWVLREYLQTQDIRRDSIFYLQNKLLKQVALGTQISHTRSPQARNQYSLELVLPKPVTVIHL